MIEIPKFIELGPVQQITLHILTLMVFLVMKTEIRVQSGRTVPTPQ